jgi:hypothetical protein
MNDGGTMSGKRVTSMEGQMSIAVDVCSVVGLSISDLLVVLPGMFFMFVLQLRRCCSRAGHLRLIVGLIQQKCNLRFTSAQACSLRNAKILFGQLVKLCARRAFFQRPSGDINIALRWSHFRIFLVEGVVPYIVA